MSAVVRAGYKQTEVGVIPEDWREFSVGAAIDFQGGSQPEKSVFSAIPRPGFIRLIQIRDYKSDRFEVFAPIALLRRFCDQGDIMIGRYGPPVFQILRGLSGAYNVALIKAVPRPEIDREFAFYFLKQDSLFEFIDKLSRRSSGQTGVDLSELRQYPLPLPPVPEQRAIATALSDVDALLAKLDALVAKKRDLKVAAMQQLLTGQTRLPGFSGEWEVKRLGDVLLRIANGAVYKPTNSHGIQITRIETISDGTIDYSRTGVAEDSPELERYKIIPGDILFSHINSLDHIGKVALYSGGQPLYHGMNLLLLRTNRDADNNFLYFWFTSLTARRQTRNLAKQAVSQASINTKELKALEVRLPPLREQTAIATVLSDMDTELTALETRRDKTRALKQGMMQELLTGRIRLV